MKTLYAALLSKAALEATCMTIDTDRIVAIETRSTWNFLGCYTHTVSALALPSGDAVPGGCGNAVINGGGPAPDGNTGCKMPCKGKNLKRVELFFKNGKAWSCLQQQQQPPSAEYANLFRDYSKITWGYDWGYSSWSLDPPFKLYVEPISDYDSAVGMQYFLGDCTGCVFNFAAIHYYQDCNLADGQSGTAWFQGNVTNAYNTLNLPLWITESQCYGTDAQQVALLQAVLPWLDSQSYVARYAYFGVFPSYLVNSSGTGLSDIGVAYATT